MAELTRDDLRANNWRDSEFGAGSYSGKYQNYDDCDTDARKLTYLIIQELRGLRSSFILKTWDNQLSHRVNVFKVKINDRIKQLEVQHATMR